MPHCQECKHYKATNDGPYCFKSSGHPKPISPIMVKDCFEERPADEPASTAPVEKPGYVPRTKVCAKCGRELPMLQFSTNRRMKDGHQSECKECVAKAGKKSRQRLNEKKRAEREKAAQAELASGVKVCRKCGRELPISAFGKGHAEHFVARLEHSARRGLKLRLPPSSTPAPQKAMGSRRVSWPARRRS